ncbi:MAG: hypothetical protein COA58_12095 [Bacteroidetes bacterium]|nr:MAG: hypothetical protein COA58_12095 [Bacteroidota bacterium]
MKKIILSLVALISLKVSAQTPLTSGYFNYHLTDRYEILSSTMSTDFFTGIKPYRRDAVSSFAQKLVSTSKADQFNKTYLQLDNSLWHKDSEELKRKPILKHFFKTENALVYVNQERFKLIMNPVLGFMGGTDNQDSLSVYRNSRGFELRGNIGKKVGFYSYVLENQVRFPNYLRDKFKNDFSVTGATLAKFYKNDARDFFNVAGYVTASPIEEITVQFGHDKNFIGNGYRSLILSDIATPNTFFKINTKVWKINYMNLYSVHTDYQGYDEKSPTARKFSALHHLSINLGKNLTIGLFENVIFDRQDSLETNRYEIDYLNPIIFYRAAEHGLNSTDNVMLGTDWKWNFLSRFSFYGQVIFDEFIKKEFFSQSSSWVNKWGYQAGLKYINVANISNLDLQIEINQVRPHVYQHEKRSQNWIHYNQSLAHPLGANFREVVSIVRYQPLKRLNLSASYIFSSQGIDTNRLSTNFGGDITRGTEDILNRNDVHLFQGLNNQISTINISATYMLWHNLFFDASVMLRNQSNPLLSSNRKNNIFRIGMRLNLAALDYGI